MSSKVTFTGHQRCLKRLETKNKSLKVSYNKLFKESLYGYIQNVKKAVAGNPDGFNHQYTMNLYRNIRAEASIEDIPDGWRVTIDAGYFVPYGLNLETPVPRFVSIPELRKWQDAKNARRTVKMALNLKNLQRKLATNPDFYPILQELWGIHAEDYRNEVFDRVKDRWESA